MQEKEYVQAKRPQGEWVLIDRTNGQLGKRSKEKFSDIPVANIGQLFPPTIEYDAMEFEDSFFSNGTSGWKAQTLVRAAEKQKCKVFDLPLAGIDLRRMPFRLDSIDDFAYQVKRMLRTDLKYPIILDNHGFIADGWHRVVRAMVEERQTIKEMRLTFMPPSDRDINKTPEE